jgi:long-subunit fatty acid transport protein
VLDPMKDEFWDFEVDANWAQTSHVDQFRVKLHNDAIPDPDDEDERVPGIQFSSAEEGASTSVPNKRVSIPKYWKDMWTFRAGGDVNVIRDRLSIRAGASYQTRAVRVPYMNIDYWPVQKIGIHLGMTLKFAERFKATLGYAHLFYEKTVVALGTGQVKESVTLNPEMALPVNEGTYQASLDVFSLQLNAQF